MLLPVTDFEVSVIQEQWTVLCNKLAMSELSVGQGPSVMPGKANKPCSAKENRFRRRGS